MTVARLEIFARRRQRIAAAPFAEFSIFQVRAGRKRMGDGRRQDEIDTGGFAAVAPGQLLHVENLPPTNGPYRAVCLCLPMAMLEPGPSATDALPWAALPVTRELEQAFAHVEQGVSERLTESLLRHRVAELVAAVALAGYRPPLERGRRLGERIRLLLNTQPAREWRAEEVAGRLALSAATLRRRLSEEASSFRGILEEVRLTHGLALVQGSNKPLKQIAAECGYASPSRFTARFRERFGTLPSDLRD
ncbi:helix-turn-helix transcriptional regulator [Dyella sp. EPa41]|uniref:helix-turn-helix transcriptional regulator n=1 Tax=Dyella sp. EPa41 TaxID=1561194 RepID=UPI0019162CBD|nr:helix-turn-helix transcriptional regulator [Dyella sp. EPa41]